MADTAKKQRPERSRVNGASQLPGDETPAFSPLYQQIRMLLTRSLQQREWAPGELIPSEHDLALRFKVSQGTVRKAIDDLVLDHLLVRRQGKGTFVATHSEAQVQFRFLRLASDDGSASRLERRFISCIDQRAPADVARVLGLKTGQSVWRVQRVLSFGGQPVVLDDIWLPGSDFKGLSAERLSRYEGPMYALFEAEFGVRMVRADEKIRAVVADAEAAGWLRVEPGAPLLSVERLSMTFSDRPVELRRGLYRTDAHHYRNQLS
jgi:GntR family transcriptional regulator